MSSHVALLGDSVFDNAAYTAGEPSVIDHLRDLLPAPWTASLHAVDGSLTTDLVAQLAGVPEDAGEIVISIGGNDALLAADLLGMTVSNTAEAWAAAADRVGAFRENYREALRAVRRSRSPRVRVTTCTIYEGNLEGEPGRLARTALKLFNDVILQGAFEARIDVIDLRAACREAAHYANPIEPSGAGGRRIAESIALALGVSAADHGVSRVFTLPSEGSAAHGSELDETLRSIT